MDASALFSAALPKTPSVALGDLPAVKRGPVTLAPTGRTVWWTGRVAIGLRHALPADMWEPSGCVQGATREGRFVEGRRLG